MATDAKAPDISAGAVASVQERSATAPLKTTSAPLTEDGLRSRLEISSPKLVKELYEIVQRRLQYESGRQQRLDAKANALLTAAGLAVTLSFTFTSAISTVAGHKLFHPVFNYVLGAFAVALAAGFAAALLAVCALFVGKGYASPANETIFDATQLRKADQIADQRDEKGQPEPGADDWGLMTYQKVMIPHFWTIAEKHTATHERKAALIQYGQGAFIVFLFSLVVICIFVLRAILLAHGS